MCNVVVHNGMSHKGACLVTIRDGGVPGRQKQCQVPEVEASVCCKVRERCTEREEYLGVPRNEWINEMWSVGLIYYYSAFEKNRILSFASTRMNLDQTTVNKINQVQKHKVYMLRLIFIWYTYSKLDIMNSDKNSYFYGQFQICRNYNASSVGNVFIIQ